MRIPKKPFFCPWGHLLQYMRSDHEDINDFKITCSYKECTKRFLYYSHNRSDLYRCEKCEYNLCESCYHIVNHNFKKYNDNGGQNCYNCNQIFQPGEQPVHCLTSDVQICNSCEINLISNVDKVKYNFRQTAQDMVLTSSRYLLQLALSQVYTAKDPLSKGFRLIEPQDSIMELDLLRAIDLLRYQNKKSRSYFIQWSTRYNALQHQSKQHNFLSAPDTTSFQRYRMKRLILFEQLVTG